MAYCGALEIRTVTAIARRRRVDVATHQDVALLRVRLLQALLDHRRDDLVGHQLARVGDLLEPAPHGRVALDLGADDVARRDRGDAQLLGHARLRGRVQPAASIVRVLSVDASFVCSEQNGRGFARFGGDVDRGRLTANVPFPTPGAPRNT